MSLQALIEHIKSLEFANPDTKLERAVRLMAEYINSAELNLALQEVLL